MAEITKFQQMNGCSACKHAAEKDPSGTAAATLGGSFWCGEFSKTVNSKDGAECPKWEYAE
jgi:hypothetical protein